MPRERRIYLAIDEVSEYCRNVLAGARDYAGGRADWYFRWDSDPQALVRQFADVRGWHPDGAIVQCNSPGIEDAIRRLGIPAVNIASALRHVGIPSVLPDNVAVGALAARYLLDRGYRRLAVGYQSRRAFILDRRDGFRAEAAAHGVTAITYPGAGGWPRGYRGAPLLQWVQSLPKSTGLFVPDDREALPILDACRAGHIRVPEDVAVLGAWDDQITCQMGTPALSSVQVPGHAIGREAARLLDGLLAGRPAPQTPLLLPPVGVTTRESTGHFACDDPHVARALAYLEARFAEACTIAEVVAATGLPRRTLQRRFLADRGHSLHDELTRIRLSQAQRLLRQTDLALEQIAARCGFARGAYLARIFRVQFGMTPGAFRAAAASGR